MNLTEARASFQRWLYMPDTGALDAMLGAIAANRLEGDPVWMLLVGPPGGGKSELLNSISKLPDAHPTGTLTEAALLSGTSAKEKAAGAKGGLLKTIGNRGIIVCKDFGSVLSMHTDARTRVLAALREVYDGSWTRHVGTDGGRTLHWEGRVGLIGGCTPSIDRHHAVMGAMGERFTLYRLPATEGKIQARAAMKHAGREREMRSDLAAVSTAVLDDIHQPRETNDEEIEYLVELASFVVRARSAVERDNYSREIELVSEAEAPGRLIIVLSRLLDGLDSIGCERHHAFAVVTKAALDSIPALRFTILQTLHEHDGKMDTNQVAAEARHPSTTTRRALEDLVAHSLVDMTRQDGPNNPPHLWNISKNDRTALERLFQGFPEKPDNPTLYQSGVPEKPSSTPSLVTPERESMSSGFSGKPNFTSDSDSNGHTENDEQADLVEWLATVEPGWSE